MQRRPAALLVSPLAPVMFHAVILGPSGAPDTLDTLFAFRLVSVYPAPPLVLDTRFTFRAAMA